MSLDNQVVLAKQIEEKVKEVIASILRSSQARSSLIIPEISLDMNLTEDLGLDSIELLDLSTAISSEFGLKVEDRNLMQMKTVKDVINYIVNFKK